MIKFILAWLLLYIALYLSFESAWEMRGMDIWQHRIVLVCTSAVIVAVAAVQKHKAVVVLWFAAAALVLCGVSLRPRAEVSMEVFVLYIEGPRKAVIENQLKTRHPALRATFFPGIAHVNFTSMEKLCVAGTIDYDATRGEMNSIALALSVRRILLASTAEWVVIFEDDAFLTSHFTENIVKRLAIAAPSTDMVWLDTRQALTSRVTGVNTCCTAGTAYRRRAIPKIAEAMRCDSHERLTREAALGRFAPFDLLLARMCNWRTLSCESAPLVNHPPKP